DAPEPVDDPLTGEDAPLALYMLYELHYRSFAGVDDGWEWEPSLLALRGRLEAAFEARLREEVPVPDAAGDVAEGILAIVEADDGPSLSRRLAASGTRDEFAEFVVHRSAYHLKEADPHTWAIPRLAGRAKAALVEIQADEYGGGRPEWVHAALFARSMRALGLDDRYGVLIDRIPGATLATVNLMSLFGLHRRLRGAVLGHLAVLETTSSEPMRRYGACLRRLGLDDATPFFDEHVQADAVHEQIAVRDMAGALAVDEPELARDVLWGAAAVTALEGDFARRLIAAWDAGRSSLLPPAGVGG
ncbi:MAG TPA: iron-containing redox enzyme family protein, partial [Miltoncostaea sp.]|nr:iron-containing redox enzyme family protein [Miltoncostaea sp.]